MDFKYDVIVIGAGHACCEHGSQDMPHHNGHEQDWTDEL